MGLTNGSKNGALSNQVVGSANHLFVAAGSYGQAPGSYAAYNTWITGSTIFGMTTDSSKSGVIADASSIKINTAELGKWFIKF